LFNLAHIVTLFSIPVLCFPAYGQIVDSLQLYGTSLDVDVYGNIFVVSSESDLLTFFSPREREQIRQIGGQGWGNEEFDNPSGIWSRNGIDIFVADYGNHRIQKYDRTLTYAATLYTREDEDPAKRFGYPTDIALSRLGDLFICDSENARILKINRSSQVDRSFGGFDAGQGRLYAPRQVEIGSSDFLYVLDKGRIMVFDTFGNFIRELGSGLFNKPSCIFADKDQILVLDDDLLYQFDANERPSSPVNIRELSEGRISGEDISSLVFSGSALYTLTPRGIFLWKLPARPE